MPHTSLRAHRDPDAGPHVRRHASSAVLGWCVMPASVGKRHALLSSSAEVRVSVGECAGGAWDQLDGNVDPECQENMYQCIKKSMEGARHSTPEAPELSRGLTLNCPHAWRLCSGHQPLRDSQRVRVQ